jgi:hypothetical protein
MDKLKSIWNTPVTVGGVLFCGFFLTVGFVLGAILDSVGWL